jgi:hypothetical protein
VTVTSLDHSSPRGMNGYYVYRAKLQAQLEGLRISDGRFLPPG